MAGSQAWVSMPLRMPLYLPATSGPCKRGLQPPRCPCVDANVLQICRSVLAKTVSWWQSEYIICSHSEAQPGIKSVRLSLPPLSVSLA